MLGKLRDALKRRQAAVEAEALVWQRGGRGVAMARAAAADPHQSEDRRQHYKLVAAIGERRLAELDGLDTATAYEVGNRWAGEFSPTASSRRGQRRKQPAETGTWPSADAGRIRSRAGPGGDSDHIWGGNLDMLHLVHQARGRKCRKRSTGCIRVLRQMHQARSKRSTGCIRVLHVMQRASVSWRTGWRNFCTSKSCPACHVRNARVGLGLSRVPQQVLAVPGCLAAALDAERPELGCHDEALCLELGEGLDHGALADPQRAGSVPRRQEHAAVSRARVPACELAAQLHIEQPRYGGRAPAMQASP